MLLGSILPGMTGKFTFKNEFSVLSAPYKLIRIMSWDDSLSQGYQTLDIYTKVGLTQQDYEAALPTILGSNILVLSPVTDETLDNIIIPEALMDGVPDCSIKSYPNIALGIHLGYYTDPTSAEWLQTEVQQLVAALTGNTSDAEIFITDNKWLTDGEYKAIEDARISDVTSVVTSRSRWQDVMRENVNLKRKIAYLEEILITLNNP